MIVAAFGSSSVGEVNCHSRYGHGMERIVEFINSGLEGVVAG